MMLLFLQTGRGGHRRVQQPEPHTQEPQGPDLPASSAPQVPGLLGGGGGSLLGEHTHWEKEQLNQGEVGARSKGGRTR